MLFVSVCRSTSTARFLASLSPTCRFRRPTGDKPYPLHRGNLLLSYISPSTWGNQRRARSHYHHSLSSKFLAPLPGTPIVKIGELHTIFYLCFLVLLVYLSVFILVSLIENHKKFACTCCCYGFH